MSGFSRGVSHKNRTPSQSFDTYKTEESYKTDIPDGQQRQASKNSLGGIHKNDPNAPFPFLLKMEAPDDIRKKSRYWLSDRRDYRITDTAHMLQNRKALSRKEANWLLAFGKGKGNKMMHKMLGDLLTVPKYTWKEGQHGIRKREDRNKIRMQTLRVFVTEAMRTADSDTSSHDKLVAFRRAHKAASDVRQGLSQTVHGQKLKIYKKITTDTLHDPAPLIAAYRSAYHNAFLNRETLPWLRAGFYRQYIKDAPDVAEAAQDLVDRGLLDGPAAERLHKAFGNTRQAQVVSNLMDLSSNETLDHADRKKIRSLVLLAFAYGSPKSALDTKNWAQTHIGRDEVPGMTDVISDAVAQNLNTVPEDMPDVRQAAHGWLLDLRRHGDWDDVKDMWLDCAKMFADRDKKASAPQNQPVSELTFEDLNFFDDILDELKDEEEPKKSKKEDPGVVVIDEDSEDIYDYDSDDDDVAKAMRTATGNVDNVNEKFALKADDIPKDYIPNEPPRQGPADDIKKDVKDDVKKDGNESASLLSSAGIDSDKGNDELPQNMTKLLNYFSSDGDSDNNDKNESLKSLSEWEDGLQGLRENGAAQAEAIVKQGRKNLQKVELNLDSNDIKDQKLVGALDILRDWGDSNKQTWQPNVPLGDDLGMHPDNELSTAGYRLADQMSPIGSGIDIMQQLFVERNKDNVKQGKKEVPISLPPGLMVELGQARIYAADMREKMKSTKDLVDNMDMLSGNQKLKDCVNDGIEKLDRLIDNCDIVLSRVKQTQTQNISPQSNNNNNNNDNAADNQDNVDISVDDDKIDPVTAEDLRNMDEPN